MSAVLDYLNLCRLCLVKDKVNIAIFDETSDVRQLFLKISACLPVKVAQDDRLPKKICDSCLYKVDLLYQFWNTTISSEKQLLQWCGGGSGGEGVAIKGSDDTLMLPQSHAHPHSIHTETIILKEERLDSADTKLVDDEYGPDLSTPTATVSANDLYSEEFALSYQQQQQLTEATSNYTSSTPNQAQKKRPRGRPPGSTKKKRQSTRSKARQDSVDDSDDDRPLAAVISDPEDHLNSAAGLQITKVEKEAESDEDYVDNSESLEPTTFVAVPSTSACELPGPSGIVPKGTTSTEPGSHVKLPKGIRIKTNQSADSSKKQLNTRSAAVAATTVTTAAGVKQHTSMYDELVLKLNHLPFIKIKKTEAQQKINPSDIVENLTKCGLIVKKVTDTLPTQPSAPPLPPLTVATEKINSDSYLDSDDVSESEYEIETLDEDLSDLEYLPQSLKRKRQQTCDTPPASAAVAAKQQQQKTSKRQYIPIKSTNYMCVMCNDKFASFELLHNHMQNTTPCRIVVITCPLCGKEFPNKSRCTAHMHTHKAKPKYPCERCGKVFANRITMQIHLEMSHTEYYDAVGDGYRCKMCEHQCTSKQLVLQHINLNHLHVSTFLCDVCGKSFLNEGGLRAHIMTHRDTKSYLCQICSKAFKMQSSLRAHIKTHDHEKRFVCDECGKSFKKNSTLAEHKKYHAGDFSHPCNWCHKRFVSRSLLNTHMKNHSA